MLSSKSRLRCRSSTVKPSGSLNWSRDRSARRVQKSVDDEWVMRRTQIASSPKVKPGQINVGGDCLIGTGRRLLGDDRTDGRVFQRRTDWIAREDVFGSLSMFGDGVWLTERIRAQ